MKLTIPVRINRKRNAIVGLFFILVIWVNLIAVPKDQGIEVTSHRILFTTGLILLLGIFVLWFVIGKEIIEIDNGELKIKWALFGVGLTRRYKLDEVRNFRISSNVESNVGVVGAPSPNLCFEYQGKNIRFARWGDPSEIQVTFSNLKSHFGKKG